ncbi:MAG: hypothetical protein ACHQ51_12300 [Elusimicrobiota bacterium]
MKISLTYWTRLEPWSRNPDLSESLQAQVRDPLWILTRQWQLGEFHGEDAGTASKVSLRTEVSPLSLYKDGNGQVVGYDANTPLEAVVEHEERPQDYRFRVQAGLQWARILKQDGVAQDVRDYFFTRNIFDLPPAPELAVLESSVRQFVFSMASRVMDGGKVVGDIVMRGPNDARRPDKINLHSYDDQVDFPDALLAALPNTDLTKAAQSVHEFSGWLEALARRPRAPEQNCWVAPRLEYQFAVAAQAAAACQVVLAADEFPGGRLDWYSLSVDPDPAAILTPPPGVVPAPPTQDARDFIPANLGFKGIAGKRWWQFEDVQSDLGDMQLDKLDLGRLLAMEFAFLHSNDWFVIPYPMKVGSLCRVLGLTVTDIFGDKTLIGPAAYGQGDERKTWSMYTLSLLTKGASSSGAVGEFFFLPPTVGATLLESAPLEEVRFLRDEMGDMVWAVEETIEGPMGDPVPGYIAPSAGGGAIPGGSAVPNAVAKLRLASEVPENWIPFLIAQTGEASRPLQLERAGFVPADGGGNRPVLPKGRILEPGQQPFRIYEQEISRSGLSITRKVKYTRGLLGDNHLWTGRLKTVGKGEGRSGLCFDVLEPIAGAG